MSEGPKITLQHIEDTIVSEHYFTAQDGRNGALAAETYVGIEKPTASDADLLPLQLLTFCVLVLVLITLMRKPAEKLLEKML